MGALGGHVCTHVPSMSSRACKLCGGRSLQAMSGATMNPLLHFYPYMQCPQSLPHTQSVPLCILLTLLLTCSLLTRRHLQFYTWSPQPPALMQSIFLCSLLTCRHLQTCRVSSISCSRAVNLPMQSPHLQASPMSHMVSSFAGIPNFTHGLLTCGHLQFHTWSPRSPAHVQSICPCSLLSYRHRQFHTWSLQAPAHKQPVFSRNVNLTILQTRRAGSGGGGLGGAVASPGGLRVSNRLRAERKQRTASDLCGHQTQQEECAGFVIQQAEGGAEATHCK
eukprot:1153952-Pelagomonas_calceolata.AAC.2